MSIRSRTHVKSIAMVFRWGTKHEHDMMVQVARLCVLYEDLHLEFSGSDAEDIKELDRIGRDPRRFYFVRRTLATLVEIEGALYKLNMNPEFKKLKRGMAKDRRQVWDKAVKQFAKRHQFLNDWRNDIGGHFHDKAARYAIDEIHSDTIGVLEFYRTTAGGADVKMPFAYDLVAVALTKNNVGVQPEKEFLEEAFSFLAKAVTAAMMAIQVVVQYTIADRFR